MADKYGYLYSRELIQEGPYAGAWNIDNPARKDPEENPIHLSDEVATAIPGKPFLMRADNGECLFLFDDQLTTEEEATLETTVSNHKNNV